MLRFGGCNGLGGKGIFRAVSTVLIAVLMFWMPYSGASANEVLRAFQRYAYREAFPPGDAGRGYRYRVTVREDGGQRAQRGAEVMESEIIVSPDQKAAVIFYQNRLQELIILRRFDAETAWMISSRARRPISIGINRNILSNYSVEDLTGADFENDYRIERVIDENEVMLEALNRKPAFPYVSLRRIDKRSYLARCYSRNRKPIKEILYKLGTVDGITFWSDFLVTDLVFKGVRDLRMQTVEVQLISVSRSLFYPNTMNRFFPIFD